MDIEGWIPTPSLDNIFESIDFWLEQEQRQVQETATNQTLKDNLISTYSICNTEQSGAHVFNNEKIKNHYKTSNISSNWNRIEHTFHSQDVKEAMARNETDRFAPKQRGVASMVPPSCAGENMKTEPMSDAMDFMIKTEPKSDAKDDLVMKSEPILETMDTLGFKTEPLPDVMDSQVVKTESISGVKDEFVREGEPISEVMESLLIKREPISDLMDSLVVKTEPISGVMDGFVCKAEPISEAMDSLAIDTESISDHFTDNFVPKTEPISDSVKQEKTKSFPNCYYLGNIEQRNADVGTINNTLKEEDMTYSYDARSALRTATDLGRMKDIGDSNIAELLGHEVESSHVPADEKEGINEQLHGDSGDMNQSQGIHQVLEGASLVMTQPRRAKTRGKSNSKSGESFAEYAETSTNSSARDGIPNEQQGETIARRKTKANKNTGFNDNRCRTCGKRIHLTEVCINEDEKTQRCGKCRNRYTQGSQGQVRDQSDTTTNGRNYECKTCHKKYASVSSLNRHELTHCSERPYICETCGKTFTMRHRLARHKRIHTGGRPYACPTCGFAFKQNYDLTKHQRIHSGEKPYACQTCEKTFRDSGGLIKHMRVHSGEKPYICDRCGRGFSDSSGLIKHKMAHDDDRPWECQMCGRRFIQAHMLRAHEKRYENGHVSSAYRRKIPGCSAQRPLQCETCGKKFNNRSHLLEHIRLHTGERPFLCQYCGRTFTFSYGLVIHIRTHTGDRPYQCGSCKKRFISSSSLDAHKKVHRECLI